MAACGRLVFLVSAAEGLAVQWRAVGNAPVRQLTKGIPMADDCLFCKIVSGDIPSAKVYEDDLCYAFDDIEPEAPVHTLIVPKQHYDNLQDGVPAELLGHLLSAVSQVAKAKGVYESGYRTVINTGPDSAATVPHLHLHILGGTKMGRFTFEGSARDGASAAE